MSFVNKASKNNVLYDLQDSRIYTLDLGDVTSIMREGHFQKLVSADEIIALSQATEGSITFTYNGMPAICKVIAKGTIQEGGQTTTQVIASLFMQQQENQYTAIFVMAMASGNVGQVSGNMIEQSISSGGGSGATIIEKTLSQWQSDGSGQQMASFSIDSTDFNNAINNDNLILKLNDSEMGGNWTLQKFMTQNGHDGNMVMFSQLSEGEVFMAVMTEDDGSYQGMAVKMSYEQAFKIESSKLYKHIVSLTDSKDNLEITLISCESSEFTSISQLEYTNDNIISYKSFKNANNNLFISLGVRDEYVMWLNGAQIENLGISNFNIVSDSVSEIKD